MTTAEVTGRETRSATPAPAGASATPHVRLLLLRASDPPTDRTCAAGQGTGTGTKTGGAKGTGSGTGTGAGTGTGTGTGTGRASGGGRTTGATTGRPACAGLRATVGQQLCGSAGASSRAAAPWSVGRRCPRQLSVVGTCRDSTGGRRDRDRDGGAEGQGQAQAARQEPGRGRGRRPCCQAPRSERGRGTQARPSAIAFGGLLWVAVAVDLSSAGLRRPQDAAQQLPAGVPRLWLRAEPQACSSTAVAGRPQTLSAWPGLAAGAQQSPGPGAA